MKTSLEIDDNLYRAVRVHAVRERTTIRALVERGLAGVLGLKTEAPSSGPSVDGSEELADLEALCAQVSALPVLSQESPDEILGYDEGGSLR